MFVRLLIGRDAGRIVEQPYHAATANLAAGTVEQVSHEEAAEAGLSPTPAHAGEFAHPEALPRGYRVEPSIDDDTPIGGFDVLDPGGVRVNQEPLRNHTEARSLAREHALSARFPETGDPEAQSLTESEDEVEIPENWRDMNAADLKELASYFSDDVRNKSDAIEVIEAEVARRAGE
jgi:hypothetical protein